MSVFATGDALFATLLLVYGETYVPPTPRVADPVFPELSNKSFFGLGNPLLLHIISSLFI